MEMLTDKQDKKWTNKQTELHQFRKQLSYDGYLPVETPIKETWVLLWGQKSDSYDGDLSPCQV